MHEIRTFANNLSIGVDWISFTVLTGFTVYDTIQFLGFSLRDFRNMPRGASGYKRMMKCDEVSILYDGTDDMGIHVNVTGSSIALLFEKFQCSYGIENPFGNSDEVYHGVVFARFCEEVRKIGHFTRIDLAIDDRGQNYYSVKELLKKQSQGRIVSKWKTSRDNCERDISSNAEVGHTLYFGSKQSEIQMRVYDKKLERNKSLSADDENYINYEWVRWELQLRKERAEEVSRLISESHTIGEVALGILSNYIRIINLDDSNKSRCTSEAKWKRFVDNISRLKITVVKPQKTLEHEIKQFEHQQGRKIAKMLLANDGDSEYFLGVAQRYAHKLTEQDKEQLINNGHYDDYEII